MNVSIAEALGLSVLGMLVVFIVLAFLMGIIGLMPLVVKILDRKKDAGGDIKPGGGTTGGS